MKGPVLPDWAIVGAAVVRNGTTGIGLVNMGATPLRASAAETALASGASDSDAAALAAEGTAAVPVRKASSARKSSSLSISRKTTGMPMSLAIVITESRVIPGSAPALEGGVSNSPFLIINRFSPLPSQSIPCELSMMASSKP